MWPPDPCREVAEGLLQDPRTEGTGGRNAKGPPCRQPDLRGRETARVSSSAGDRKSVV